MTDSKYAVKMHGAGEQKFAGVNSCREEKATYSVKNIN